MKIETIIYIVIGWIFLNALIPLLINSFERLYQSQIDLLVKGLISTVKFIFWKLIHFLLFILFIPTIAVVKITERVYPQLLKTDFLVKTEIAYTVNALLKIEFPANVLRDREEKNEKEASEKKQNTEDSQTPDTQAE